MRRILLLAAILSFSCSAWSQRLLTVPDFTGFSERNGSGEPGSQLGWTLLPLPDGGMLVAGRFEVWYEGNRIRDLIRFKPDGNPDTSWKVVGDEKFTEVSKLTLTPYGLFVLARSEGSGKNGLWIAPLDGSRPLSRVSVLGDAKDLYSISNFDRSNDSIYAITGAGLARVSAATGQASLLWNGTTANEAFPRLDLVADSGGGLWSGHSESILMLPRYYTYRFSIDSMAADPAGRLQTTQLFAADLDYSLVGATSEHVYFGRQRHGRNGDRDGTWGTQYKPLLVTEKYAYVKAFDGLYERVVSSIVRVPTSNRGVDASWRFEMPPGLSMPSALIAWPTPGDADNLGILGRSPPVDNVPSPLGLVVKEDLTGMTDPRVVEYYLPALKRYFITGRKNEQDALDALPQSFQRTGMTFAAKSSRYRDIAEQPVCRMYFPPASGGSNTHFYGVGSDCGTLNKLGGMKYEGYDFSVLRPAGGLCAAAAPYAVTRLYNNKAASNESNHRYVVSATTKARMLAQGWIDEGPVFCVSSVVDAEN